MVLTQPEPSALFLGFGDNSLNFELRVFVRGLENRLSVIHHLHLAIEREFRNAGINIAFPQRDIHLDTTKNGAARREMSARARARARVLAEHTYVDRLTRMLATIRGTV